MDKKKLTFMGVAFLLGALWFVSLRVIAVQDTAIHYHANMNLYVNGQKDAFDSFTQYEEVQACSGNDTQNPKGRTHLHKPNNDVVHVHDNAVTWGAFFANIGYGITNQALTTTAGTFVDGVDGNQLTFIVNSKKVDTIVNRVISDKDALLVSYGNEDEATLIQRFNDIRKNAAEVNGQFDPTSCSGAKPRSFWDKVKVAFNPAR